MSFYDFPNETLFVISRKREQYLKSYMQTELDNNWTIVDADGDVKLIEENFKTSQKSDFLNFRTNRI